MFEVLTPREMEVLRLMWDGLTQKEIGVKLGIFSRTVEFHKIQMKDRLGMKGPGWNYIYRIALKEGVIHVKGEENEMKDSEMDVVDSTVNN